MCIKDNYFTSCFVGDKCCKQCLNDSIKELLGLEESALYAFEHGAYNEEIDTVIELMSFSGNIKLQIKFVIKDNELKFVVIRKFKGSGEQKTIHEHYTNELIKVLNKYIRSKFMIINL